MENSRKRYGLSENSHLLTVPASFSVRCHRSDCLGSECVKWQFCGPASPFENYLAYFPHAFVNGCETVPKAPSIPA